MWFLPKTSSLQALPHCIPSNCTCFVPSVILQKDDENQKKYYYSLELASKVLCSLSSSSSAISSTAIEPTTQFWPVLHPTVDSVTLGGFMREK
jgi:hypothetical protein